MTTGHDNSCQSVISHALRVEIASSDAGFVEIQPSFMSFLSLTLPDKANRLANLIAGTFFVVWEIVFLVFVYIGSPAYEVFWGIAYLVFVALVVWYAWQWPQKGSIEVTP